MRMLLGEWKVSFATKHPELRKAVDVYLHWLCMERLRHPIAGLPHPLPWLH
jgi:hypothetical protein